MRYGCGFDEGGSTLRRQGRRLYVSASSIDELRSHV
jgi:hypothetical protein